MVGVSSNTGGDSLCLELGSEVLYGCWSCGQCSTTIAGGMVASGGGDCGCGDVGVGGAASTLNVCSESEGPL